MAKLTKSQERKAIKLANVLRLLDFTDVQVHLDSRWIVSGKRDFISSNITKLIPKKWSFYYDGKHLDVCIF